MLEHGPRDDAPPRPRLIASRPRRSRVDRADAASRRRGVDLRSCLIPEPRCSLPFRLESPALRSVTESSRCPAVQTRRARGSSADKFDILLVPQICSTGDAGSTSTGSAGFSTRWDPPDCGRKSRDGRDRSEAAQGPAGAPRARAVRRARGRPRPGCRRAGRPSRRVGARSSACADDRGRRPSTSAPGSDARQQPAVGARSPRSGKPSRNAPRARPPRRQRQQRARASRAPAASPDPSSTAPRLLLVVEHPVVERAVRLQVAHRRPGRGRDRATGCRPGRPPARAARRAATSRATRPKFARSS